MKMNKYLIILIFSIMLCTNVFSADLYNSDNYDKVQSDSVFVVGVDWQKIGNSDDYTAYFTVDLNYVGIRNPLNNPAYQVVEAYQWRNWFLEWFDIGETGTIMYTTDENGDETELFLPDFYYEIPYVGNIEDANRGSNLRVGYYGLPFYISEVNFMCDINDKSKGFKNLIPKEDEMDNVQLVRPIYEGLNDPENILEEVNVPLGWKTNLGERVRYYDGTLCSDMDTTSNSQLYFKLEPNPYYRHFNPDYESSEEWEYSDIITSLDSISNKESLPFKLDIEIDFGNNFWDYTVSQEESDQLVNTIENQDYDLDCEVLEGDANEIYTVKYSELTEYQKLVINSGEQCIGIDTILDCWGTNVLVTCSFPQTNINSNINKDKNTILAEVTSMRSQREVVSQIDILDKKLEVKRFLTNNILPMFAVTLLLMFYAFQLFIVGIMIIGIVPLIFNQFIQGLKDAFDIDELIKENNQMRNKK